jgi:eukaryotic-like serine/threonine-protein kinase
MDDTDLVGQTISHTFHGLGPYGTYDMAGNVREWIWNESSSGRRWILGGASADPSYMFVLPNSLPPLDRSAANGVRCARYEDAKPVPDPLLTRVEASPRDNRTAKAVSEEVFGVFKRQMAYAKSAFDSHVDAKDESSPDSITGPANFPRSELIREAVAWLDRYLGSVKPAS